MLPAATSAFVGKKNHESRKNTPYINQGKGCTLAQGTMSLLEQKMKRKLMWVWWVPGSTWLQGTGSMMIAYVFDGMLVENGHGAYVLSASLPTVQDRILLSVVP
eukprot:1144643-Pelagomonas_calceolata.AAC.3